MTGAPPEKAAEYLARIEFPETDPRRIDPEHDTLRRLVSAHLTAVPFENLAITGHPHRDDDGEGVSLAIPALYEKIVRHGRGGFCFENNGLFVWLLRGLGYDVDRCAARVVSDADALGRPPANHHTALVHLDRPYVVDAGSGTPQPREPVPLDGTVVTDAVGIDWRTVPDDTALSDYTLQYRESEDWSIRYRFQTEPRELCYFAATCEFLANEPGGTFTSSPIVKRSTETGTLALDADSLTRDGERTAAVDVGEWDRVLHDEFGISLPSEADHTG